MSPKTKKFLITSETHEQTLVRFSKDLAAPGYCDRCSSTVNIVSLDNGARGMKVGTRELLALIDSDVVHGFENEDGILVLCGQSLALRLSG